MSTIRSHIENYLHKAISQRTYTPNQVRKVIVGSSRFVQKTYKRVNKLYIHALMSYPELWSDEALIKSAVKAGARDDYFIAKQLSKLEKLPSLDTPTITWFRKTYQECKFDGPIPEVVLKDQERRKKNQEEGEAQGLFVKTDAWEKLYNPGNTDKIKDVHELEEIFRRSTFESKDF